ncbi:MAG: hypothetical protein J0M19_05645 [Sphingomonadales bacterium]|nr:hypothetical protein [Sphingomonadales bacterium]
MFTAFMVAVTIHEAKAQTSPSIEWEIAHRYRLFRNEGHFRAILSLYRGLPEARRREDPAMALEIALEKAAAERRFPRDLFGDPSSIERYGWASALLNETCFQSGNRGHYLCRLYALNEKGEVRRDNRGRPAPGEAFMEPRATDVLARISLLKPELASANCNWSAGPARVSAPCASQVRLQGIPFDQEFMIDVQLADGTPVAEIRGQRAHSVFIAGIGDSFSSGEGNPDKPAWLSGEPGYGLDYSGSSPLANGRKRLFPTRARSDGGEFGGWGQPIWLNTQCHRSLYSQHVRASLALALEQPHLAVTFTGYSCTGAETHEGILGYWQARSDVSDRFRDDSPQLMRLLRDYCADPRAYLAFDEPEAFDWRSMQVCKTWRLRPPDVILLSIGGNDIGFARVIAGQTIGHHAVRPPPLWNVAVNLWIKAADPLTFEKAKDNIARLIPGNISTLHQALDKHLRPDAGAKPKFTLLQTGYPLLTRSGSGTCEASDDGMDVHAALRTRPETGAEGVAFVRHFNARLRDAVSRISNPRWIFTDGHAELFAGHSFCDHGATPREAFTSKGYDPVISGSLEFPMTTSPGSIQRKWSPYKPDDWRAYRPRQRWFVTPNDGFLTGHYLNSDFPAQDKVQPLIAATLSGAFHPNALGHAATADVVLKQLRKQLGVSPP